MSRQQTQRHGVLRSCRAIVLAAALVTVAACAKKVAPEEPAPPPAPLEVPVTPPRVLAPIPEPEPLAAQPPPAPAPPAKPRPPSRPPAGEVKGETQKPELVEPAAPPADNAKPAETSTPALRTPQTADDGQAERRVRDVLARAGKALEVIKRASLSNDARVQYDTARRFIDQATGALNARNYMFAAYLADKADTLARGLSGR